MRPPGTPRHTMARLKRYGNLTTAVNYRYPSLRCEWVKSNAIVVDAYGLTTVELGSVFYKDDQWVLANRIAQVAYYPKPRESKKHVVVSGKQRIEGADGVESPEEYNNY